ncbi:MAG TPA: Uma2 family endonuclease [Thermoanaerobaculia bacterium]|nr:Uma2 family endonuclease [Thermoanaerobaculia bacterium]
MKQSQTAQMGPYTWRDFVELDEDDPRELLDGQLVEIELPTWTHERIVAALIAILTQWSWSRKAGQVLASGYRLRIDERRGTMPDVQFYRKGNPPSGQEKGLECGRPDLVVEVISPSSRSKDSVRKLYDYAAIGVPEYWLLDPEAHTLERLVLRDGVYSIVEAVEGDALFQPEEFDGLEVDLGRLWNETADGDV